LQLDKLTTEMRLYYQSSGCAAELASAQAGDIVAAPYGDSSDWYRARVLGTLENGNLDLYYVDFGDNGEAPREALRALRSDFLSLPFQAIECSLADLGNRGDVVSVKKHLGRNKLLPQGLAVYASPENRKMFEEEKKLRQEGKLEVLQTQSGEKTIRFLKSCRLEVGMKNNVKWELNNEIVARHFLKNVSGSRRRCPEPAPCRPEALCRCRERAGPRESVVGARIPGDVAEGV
ncbi:PREDICTED: tudor domain-containing protein 7-like, partial [Nipponia nippon]|uniref:tudor domain-containing protein 7-like n=1 Tax=Nipponia nippon TaxID=128390 RepID=UPI000510E2E6